MKSKISEDKTYEYIDDCDIIQPLSNKCPFCKTDTVSGSWSPEICPNCKAVYFFGRWSRDLT